MYHWQTFGGGGKLGCLGEKLPPSRQNPDCPAAVVLRLNKKVPATNIKIIKNEEISRDGVANKNCSSS